LSAAWDGSIRLSGETLGALAARLGGRVLGSRTFALHALRPLVSAREGDLAPLLSSRYLKAAQQAAGRGAAVLVDASLAACLQGVDLAWVHDHATWALAGVLDGAIVPDADAQIGDGSRVAPTAVLGPRVVIGARVTIGAGAVIGHPGFGWAQGPGGVVRAVPQLGGVTIEDDVSIGPLCTVDSGTLAPTRIRRGAKLDAHVHVGHNGDIGEGTILAAQCGLAGSVTLGRGVLVGGQAGFADHVTVGDGARVAGKSGVIGDVPPGAVVAGYPAVSRARWLRALASLYRSTSRARSRPTSP
jgi:UDP-3-O-[3-hydroxymyristoyl] glucosamine N-acyltransferase